MYKLIPSFMKSSQILTFFLYIDNILIFVPTSFIWTTQKRDFFSTLRVLLFRKQVIHLINLHIKSNSCYDDKLSLKWWVLFKFGLLYCTFLVWFMLFLCRIRGIVWVIIRLSSYSKGSFVVVLCDISLVGSGSFWIVFSIWSLLRHNRICHALVRVLKFFGIHFWIQPDYGIQIQTEQLH